MILLSWIIFYTAAFAEGVLRALVLEPKLPTRTAEIIGAGIVLMTAVILSGVMISRGQLSNNARSLLLVGLVWTILTIAAEFIVFGFIFGTPIKEIIAGYDVTAGELFPFALMIFAFVPWLTGCLLGKVRSS